MPKSNVPGPIQSTAGAVAVKNEKGQSSMQKVKVHRYVSGKRPDYAPRSSSEEESEEEEFSGPPKVKQEEEEVVEESQHDEFTEVEKLDPRLRRLMQTSTSSKSRRVQEPEVLDSDSEEEERPGRHHDSESDSGDDDLEEDELERRRAFLRQRVLEKREEEELLAKEEEKDSESSESESEYEEYTDSEEEARPRLKPVFVRKTDRVTIKDKEDVDELTKRTEDENKKKASERRSETLKIVEKLIVKERKGNVGDDAEKEANNPQITDVNTDDENEEAEYEAWKLRELKRIKRDRDEREAYEREKSEIERLHGLTEEERRLEMKLKPKVILNKAHKGKYKFLQKYYHRGVFYLDKEDDVLKRDYSEPTLEDHFDKTILPKVMQVKNFGRSGRTKYTHLVDQDTTSFDSPWQAETSQNIKFHATQAAGVRHVFERPSTKKRKTE